MMGKFIQILLFFAVLVNYSCAGQNTDPESVISKINVPKGFVISLFADDVPNARTLTSGGDGIIYVGTGGKNGEVFALQDVNGDGRAEKRYIIATGLYLPNGVAFHNGSLYVAEINRIIRYDNINKRLANPPEPVVVYNKFPDNRHHGWKYLRFGPDGKLYTGVGAPCNICNPEKQIYASLVRLNKDGSDFEIIARGIRNTVGFDWHPVTGELYFTENGRDHMGDNIPPDELNKWSKKGQQFGYPFCHGDKILDPEFGKGKDCKDYVPPEWQFKAHMAPLGIRFYQGEQFPEQYKNQLFVAQHGSWNRSVPHGYRIVLVRFKNGKAVSESVFANGWLEKNGNVLGRPTDILQLSDGSLLVSDNYLGVVYKIEYRNK